MQSTEALVMSLMFVGGFAMIFGIVYLRTRENMAMIEKGMNPKRNANMPAPFRSLKAGLLFFSAGLGLLLAFIIDRNMMTEHHESAPVYFSLLAIGGGLGLIGSYAMEKKEWDRRQNLPE